MDFRLGVLECKLIDGGVNFRIFVILDEIDFKVVGFYIFYLNRSRVVYFWGFIFIINWGKNLYRSFIGEKIGKWYILIMKIFIFSLLNVNFFCFNVWNKIKN